MVKVGDFMSIFEIIILVVAIIAGIEALIFNSIGFDLSIFNPIRNYNKWTSFNWFGISVITILLNIIFFVYAICYWTYKIIAIFCRLIYWLLTVGRG
jgi:hypothetical protein